jgi:hypothetical protein
MRFAYADPPYPGQSKRLYGSHLDYAGEVDHADLIGRLGSGYPDGWALSTSVEACDRFFRHSLAGDVTNRRPQRGRSVAQSWAL